MLAALLAVACVAPAPVPHHPPPPETYVVQSQEVARSLTLTVGQPLVLRLPANRSTGYRWKLVTEPKVLKTEGEPRFEQNPSADNMVGVSGNEVWHFLALQQGIDLLRFEYRRSWEEVEVPARIVTYHVNVR